jgi:thiol-disulfide isomerase/thioredoxin
MRKIIFHLIGYTVVAGGFFWAGALTRDYLVKQEAREDRARPGKFLNRPAPEVQTTTLQGKPWKLSDQRGKVVVIEGWAIWCAPCIAHLPESKRLYERFGNNPDFEFIGASMDGNAEKVGSFCASHDMPWGQLVESGRALNCSLALAFDLHGIPFTCVIDKSGVVRRYDSQSTEEYAGEIGGLIESLLSQVKKNLPTSPHRDG